MSILNAMKSGLKINTGGANIDLGGISIPNGSGTSGSTTYGSGNIDLSPYSLNTSGQLSFDLDGSFLGSVSDALFGTNFTGNEVNKQIANMNVQALKDINAENIAFQTQENAITRLREDNAVQRAASDMTAAGLSKTLAAGSPAPSQALSAPHAEPVQNQYRYEAALGKLDLFNRLKNLKLEIDANERANNLNAAQVENIEADTVGKNNVNETFLQNFQNEQDLKMSQSFLFKEQAKYNSARTLLENIEGKYRADFLEKQIDKMVADIRYSNMGTRERAQSISEAVARENNLNASTRKTLEDMAYRKLEFMSLEHDIEYAEKYNLPVGMLPTGLLGSGLSTGYSLGMRVKNGISDLLSGGLYSNGSNRAW